VRKDDPLEQLSHYPQAIGRARYDLHPLEDIIHSNQNELVTPRRWEGSNDVKALYIEYFNFKDEVEGHLTQV